MTCPSILKKYFPPYFQRGAQDKQGKYPLQYFDVHLLSCFCPERCSDEACDDHDDCRPVEDLIGHNFTDGCADRGDECDGKARCDRHSGGYFKHHQHDRYKDECTCCPYDARCCAGNESKPCCQRPVEFKFITALIWDFLLRHKHHDDGNRR